MKRVILVLTTAYSLKFNAMQVIRKPAQQARMNRIEKVVKKVTTPTFKSHYDFYRTQPHLKLIETSKGFTPSASKFRKQKKINNLTPSKRSSAHNYFQKLHTQGKETFSSIEESILNNVFNGNMQAYFDWKSKTKRSLKGKGIFSLLEHYEMKLTSIGLSEEETKIYEELLKNSTIARRYHEFLINKYKAIQKRNAAQKIVKEKSKRYKESETSFHLPTPLALQHLQNSYLNKSNSLYRSNMPSTSQEHNYQLELDL